MSAVQSETANRRLKEEDLLDKLLANDADTIAAVRTWPELLEQPASNGWASEEDRPLTPGEKLGIARWFVRRMGGTDVAERAIALLKQAEKELA